MRSDRPLRKALFLPVLRLGLLVLLGGLCLLSGFVFVGLGLRPELWVVGPELFLRTFWVGFGTSLPPLFPILVGVLFFLLARRQPLAWAPLGLGAGDLWFRLWPLSFVLLTLSVALSFGVGPQAWASVDGLRGAPLSARVAWTDLKQGSTRVGPEGGWLRMEDRELHFESGDGQVIGSAGSFEPLAEDVRWELRDLRLELVGSAPGVWSINRLALQLDEDQAVRYRQPSSSPWTAGPIDLLERTSEDPRAAKVLGRRLLQTLGLLPLAGLFWWLGWPQGKRPGGLVRPADGLVAALVAYFVTMRLAEEIGGVLAVAMGPLLAVGLVVLLVRWAQR